MNTSFIQLHFTLERPAEKHTPQTLFAIRQLFPNAFRRVTGCLTKDHGCSAGPDCPCRLVFEQRLTPDPSALRRYQKPSLPFAFKIPLLPESCRQGSEVELTLVIAGAAISHLDLFVKAVRLMFASPGLLKGWRLCAVEAAAGDGTRTVIPVGGAGTEFSSLPLLSFDELFSSGCVSCQRVTINFLTPVRLLHKGAPLRDIPFSAVAGALFRRISALAYYYGGEELPHDFKWLAEKSREISCSCSDLHWVNRGGGLQGVEGEAVFSGELTDFIPFLTLGSRLNIGKGASYGMGGYELVIG